MSIKIGEVLEQLPGRIVQVVWYERATPLSVLLADGSVWHAQREKWCCVHPPHETQPVGFGGIDQITFFREPTYGSGCGGEAPNSGRAEAAPADVWRAEAARWQARAVEAGAALGKMTADRDTLQEEVLRLKGTIEEARHARDVAIDSVYDRVNEALLSELENLALMAETKYASSQSIVGSTLRNFAKEIRSRMERIASCS